jgi:hypothetical protein
MTEFSFRWLGVAGLEFHSGATTLLVDPFFSRPPIWRILGGPVRPDPAAVAHHIERADAVLVTHSHYDHLFDVPEVVRRTGADVFGSANTVRLLAANGIAEANLHQIQPGDRISIGAFGVQVFPGYHSPVPLGRWLNAPLRQTLRPPLRLMDYRMDVCLSYALQTGSLRLAVGAVPEPAELLFINSIESEDFFRGLLARTRPRWLVPIHWDNLFGPLRQPARPGIRPGALTLRRFRAFMTREFPSIQVLVPEIFREYSLDDLKGR